MYGPAHHFAIQEKGQVLGEYCSYFFIQENRKHTPIKIIVYKYSHKLYFWNPQTESAVSAVKNALGVINIRLDITKEMISERKNRSVDGSCSVA